MNRIYTFKKEDFIEESSVEYIHINSVVGGELYFRGKKVEECIINSTSFSDLFIKINSKELTEVYITYKQSYDGSRYSLEDSTLKVIFKEVIQEEVTIPDFEVLVNKYLLPINYNLKHIDIYKSLVESNDINVGEEYIIVPLFRDNITYPDRYKHILGNLNIKYEGNYKLITRFKDSSVSLNNITLDVSTIDNMYLLFPKSSFNSHESIVIKSDVGNYTLCINDLDFNYKKSWCDWYGE